MSSSSSNNNNTEERYPFLSQYSKDLERSRTETAPEVSYSEDTPKCKDCGNYFFHDWDDHRYTCRCPHSIKEADIEYSPFNVNARYKPLEERAKQSSSAKQQQGGPQQQQSQSQYNQASNNANRARIVTERGTTSSDGASYGYGGIGGDSSHHTTFQSFDPRANLIRERRGYSDHSRTSEKQEPTFIHPLDKELIDKGYQIREVYEIKRQPNSPGVSRNLSVDPRAPKPYPRYTDDEIVLNK
jgi:predicted Zn-ribbon and HTH transcriptional regulator